MTPGELIRTRRKALGLTQSRLAAAAGTNQQTIDKIEKDAIRHSRFFARIAAELGLRLEELIPDAVPSQPASVIPGSILTGARDLPVHAAAEAGKGQIVVTSDAVDWVMRPAPLANVRGGYGLIVVGESMVPEFEPGDTALVNPHLPPIAGSTCVFYTVVQDGGEVRATIRRLVRDTREAWLVRQWNAPEGEKAELKLAHAQWTKCHPTVGKYSRR
jgi:transcriptional regulator with XRE-family HTH domain